MFFAQMIVLSIGLPLGLIAGYSGKFADSAIMRFTDLVYARLSLLLCAADRVLPNENTDLMERHHDRRQRRSATLRRVSR